MVDELRMVVGYILGGLGNQMFQYAAGRALALATGQPLLLDLSGFANYRLHQGFEIERVFRAPVAPADAATVRKLLGWRSAGITRRVLKHLQSPFLRGSRLVIEPHFNYWPDLMERKSASYLMGYWQSEKYFEDVERTIRSDFTFRAPLRGVNAEIEARMRDTHSVSLHVRRTDYISHRKTAEIMHVQDVGYYRSAAELLARELDAPVYYVFSDDMAWVRENLGFLPRVELIDHNRGGDSYQDMQLMSRCKHHVIANSSFSWWGAWLNPDPGKIVVAPSAWFRNGLDDTDLIPSRWTRL